MPLFLPPAIVVGADAWLVRTVVWPGEGAALPVLAGGAAGLRSPEVVLALIGLAAVGVVSSKECGGGPLDHHNEHQQPRRAGLHHRGLQYRVASLSAAPSL